MKRLTIILFSLLALGFGVSAQSNLYVWSNDGSVSVYDAESVDILNVTAGKNISLSATTLSVNASQFKVKVDVSLGEGIKAITTPYEVGVCHSSTNKMPTIDYDCSKVKNDTAKITLRDPETTFYYRAYLKLLDEVFYSDVYTVTTLPEDSVMIDGHKFIDLGLPSGLLWATCNVGATKITDYGDYYAWGDTSTKQRYFWDSYQYGSCTLDDAGYLKTVTLTKYYADDDLRSLETTDEAAIANWGSNCRMPTYAEIKELDKYCEWDWGYYYNGTAGIMVTGPNGNKILFPAAGLRIWNRSGGEGASGYIWTSDVCEEGFCENNYRYAHQIFFDEDYHDCNSYDSRCDGGSVRPVAVRPTQE